MSHRKPFWLTVAALVAAFAVVGSDSADAGNAAKRGRKRRPHRFLSAPAPEKGRTPALDAAGAPAGAARDVAGGAAEGVDRQNVLSGGAAVVLSATRALVANPYRGLAVVDVSDPDAPVVIGSVMLRGSADRVFVDGTTALVVSQDWDGAAGSTTVAAVDLSDETSPAVAGTVSVEGSFVQAVASGSDLVLVTNAWGWGPYAILAGTEAGMRKTPLDAAGNAAGTPDGMPPSPDFWYPGGGESMTRVARIVRGTTGAPEVAGVLEVDGSMLASAVEGDDVVLAMDRTVWGTWDAMGNWTGGDTTQRLALVDVDASAAPVADGETALDGLSGVSQIEIEGDVARLVGWSTAGTNRIVTYRLGSGAPAALGSIDLATWPSASAFVGDSFVFAYSTGSNWDDWTEEPDSPFGPATGARKNDGSTNSPTGPAASVRTIDLSDPTSPALGGTLDVGDGWIQSLHAADGDVIATLSQWDGESSTQIVRIDLADPAAPTVGATAEVPGSFYTSQTLGDLLLLSGGSYTDEKGYVPQVVPVSAADGGLVAGAAFDSASWMSAAAFEAPILAVASIDSLSLVDLSDLSAPVVRGTARLAVNVSDIAVLSDGVAACLVTDYVGGDVEIRTVALPRADALAPLDTVTLGTGDARLFRDGSMLYVLGTDWSTGRGSITVVDAADPSALRVRGSLDLASYPGQAFLVNGSLVMVREAWSLFADLDPEDGTAIRAARRKRTRSEADPFGRCPNGWLRDELSAVIDIVDLSNPDAPRAAVRKRVRWDWGGEAIVRGSTLYIPSYSWSGRFEDGSDATLYGVRPIDLTTPTEPRVGPLVDVPGALVAAADENGRVLTASYEYDETDWTVTSKLNLVDVTQRDWRDRVIASRTLDGSPGAVVAGDAHAYVATESWNYDSAESSSSLATLSLSDLAVTSTQARDGFAWGGRIAGGHLFLRSWGWTGTIDTYDLSDPAQPVSAGATAVDGVGTTVEVAGNRAFVPGGYRGVIGFDLVE